MSTRQPVLYEDATQTWGLIQADALLLLARLPDHSIDAVITDPPYGIDFHGEAWDGRDIRRAAGTQAATASEALQCWTMVWAGECRRVLKPGGHLLAFGAPRTFHRLVAGIEDAHLEIRDVLMWVHKQGVPKAPQLPKGLGTTLKPAYEPILLARAPLQGNTKTNLQRWGTGVLNIEAARVGETRYWPANIALSHSPDCPVRLLDNPGEGPSRLFYCAKTKRSEREAGCERLPARLVQIYNGPEHPPRLVHNTHPTVKPLSLMRWLIRLAVPPGGVVLDPFAGSGSTGIAAVLEDRVFLGIEREGEYVDIACARLTHHAQQAAAEAA
jgi:site-specific DNA-methyltransferase (adenine-specific)